MTEILLYGVVGDWWDDLEAKTLVPLIADGSDDINVRINSPGGYVMEGLAILNALAAARAAGRKVTCHIDGLAASMASVIAMVGDEIIMAENALMMIHNPWEVAVGDAAELRRAADRLDTIRDQLVGIYSKRTGLSRDELVPMLDAETWLTAEQALEQKFVTQVFEPLQAAACDISAFGFRKAPDSPHLVGSMGAVMASIRGGAKAGISSAVAAILKNKDRTMPQGNSAAQNQPANTNTNVITPPGQQPANQPAALTQADIDRARTDERERVTTIRALGAKHKVDPAVIDQMISDGTSLADARSKMLDILAEAGDSAGIGHNSPARVTADERDKFRTGATNWLLAKAGVANIVAKAAELRKEKVDLDPGEFRGVSNVSLARHALAMSGVRDIPMSDDAIVRAAMTQNAIITQTTSDFPVLFEQAIHKTLQAAYATTPDTWSRFCGTGTVTDFRPHSRYLRGSFGALDTVNEAGEFKNKPIPDLAKEQITAKTKGNIINLSRQAIVNDDMEVFSGLAVDLGRAAKLTIEVDVYALLASNPTMNDGVSLFDAAHGNLAGAGAAPSVAAFDAIRVAMAMQKDVSGNEFLDIRPSVLLVPIALGGGARRINNAQYDPDVTGKFQLPNIVAGLFNDVVDTPRLSGTAYYVFSDPSFAPALEVVFLNGVSEPFVDSQDGWRTDGVEWKVRHDYGVGAVNWRSAYKQPGA